jgi:ubiquinone biosynthesis protein
VGGRFPPQRVMVGTDRSQTAERAVAWAATFADRFSADLHLVQVIRPDEDGRGVADRLRAANDDIARHARSIAGDRGRGRAIAADDPAMAIVEAAEADAIDVLVVGNAGMAGRKEFLLGNVPNRVSHNARCTVIIVNTQGLDGRGPGAGPAPSGADRNAARPHRVFRASAIASVFAKHGLRELFGWPEEDGAVGARRQARRLRAALEELGPTFAKIGQLLSTRPDLLPPEYIEELSGLQDRVNPLTEEQVVRVMEAELAVPWEDVFETIEREPLAAGSIAQVHRASLTSGERVVVKVQRPDAKALITEDLALLEVFVEQVGAHRGVRRLIDVPAVFDHLSRSLQRELDFALEGRNAGRLRAALDDFPRLGVPAVYTDLSTARLLVMRDVAGVGASEVPTGAVGRQTAHQLVESFCKQILIDGFFHADPHPGNLMWQSAEQRLYFLDLGAVDEVDPDMREVMILVLTAFWQGDAGFLSDAILMLSDTRGGDEPDVEGFRKAIADLIARHRGASTKTVQLGAVLQEIMELSFRHRVPLPGTITLAGKALGQMQLVAARFDPDLDPFDVAGRFLLRWLVRRTIARSDPKTLFYESQKIRVRIVRVFEALERLVGARPGHKPDFNFRATPLEEIVRRASRRIALAMTAGFAVLATALVAISDRANPWTSGAFGAIALAGLIVLAADLVRSDR